MRWHCTPKLLDGAKDGYGREVSKYYGSVGIGAGREEEISASRNCKPLVLV